MVHYRPLFAMSRFYNNLNTNIIGTRGSIRGLKYEILYFNCVPSGFSLGLLLLLLLCILFGLLLFCLKTARFVSSIGKAEHSLPIFARKGLLLECTSLWL